MEHGKISICKRLDSSCGVMERRKRLRVSEVNPHLICVLCGGYYIDATTIIECLHTFCKTCIVGYLEASKHCPVCDNLVHKTKPHLRLRPDHTLQDIVYKLVPGLFQDEMKKRREFYKDEIESGRLGEHGIPEERERIVYAADEQFSVVLELSPGGAPPLASISKPSKQPRLEVADRRYLMCPGSFTVGHLKKFIKMKFNLPGKFQVDFYHTDETLSDHFTLVDIAYIYSWRRKGPLRLYYSVYTNPAKRFKPTIEEPVITELDVGNKSDTKPSETSGYFSDDEKHHSEASITQETDESKNDSVLEGDGIDIDIQNETKTDTECALEETVDKSKSKHIPVVVEPTLKNTVTEANEDTSKNHECMEVVESSDNKKESIISDISVSLKSYDKDMIKTNDNTPREKSFPEEKSTKNEVVVHSNKVCNPAIERKNSSMKIGSTEETVVEETIVNEKVTETVEMKTDEDVDSKVECSNDSRKIEDKPEQKLDRPCMVEASTDTIPCTSEDVVQSHKDTGQKQSKACLTDEDISEPVVSSTQNTQGCQTESPVTEKHETNDDSIDVPHSSECDTNTAVSPCHKSTVDVSCETDNFVVEREKREQREQKLKTSQCIKPKERSNASIMIYTNHVSSGHKQKSVHCSTDVYDFNESDDGEDEKIIMNKLDRSTDLTDFPIDSHKRKTLSVDCSVTLNDIHVSPNKRKSCETDHCSAEPKLKKTDFKVPKRSVSYAGNIPTPKAYCAQPLSPTKLTLKFTQPKSPLKASPKSPSKSDPSGFQSQYQSFVMELPEKPERFECEEQLTVKTMKQGSNVKPTVSLANLPIMSHDLPSSQKKSHSKTGRPRGRPPKNRSLEAYMISPKEKKHKSRSRSPKRKKSTEKEKERMIGNEKTFKTSKTSNNDTYKPTNAYSWINKIDTANAKSTVTSDPKCQKSTSEKTEEDKPQSDLRIPKMFFCNLNGQYTITTGTGLNASKQSSPVAPAPKTVFTSEVSWKDKKSDTPKPKQSLMQDYKIPKINRIATVEPKVPIPTTIKSMSNDKKLKVSDNAKEEPKKAIVEPKKEKANHPQVHESLPVPKENTKPLMVSLSIPTAQASSKTDANQNKIDAGSSVSSSHEPISSNIKSSPSSSELAKPPSTSVLISERKTTERLERRDIDATPKSFPKETSELKDKPPVSKSKDKASVTTATTSLPEYRHQSPFFTSFSGAKLATSHRQTTHLNVPNLSSHFSGTHPLYSQGRYANERLGSPIFGSFSLSDKTPTSVAAAVQMEETRRFEAAIAATSFLNPYQIPNPYLGFMHSHLLSSLPHPHLSQPHPSKGHYTRPESPKPQNHYNVDHSTNGANRTVSPSSPRTPGKSSNGNGKGKEKSLDKVINAITERRAKETVENVNGIDLSTRGCKKSDFEYEGEKSGNAKLSHAREDVSKQSDQSMCNENRNDALSRKDESTGK